MIGTSARPYPIYLALAIAAISSSHLLGVFDELLVQKASGRDAGLRERFTAEYPNAEKQLTEKIKYFVVSGKTESKTLSGKVYSTRALTVSASDARRLILRTDRSVKGQPNSLVSEVFCDSPEYKFKLTKKPQSEQYVINNYTLKSKTDETFERLYNYYANGATVYFGKTLSSRLLSKSIEIKDVKEVERNSERLVQIEYQDLVKEERGSVWLDPAKGWTIREVDIIREKDGDENQLRFTSKLRYKSDNFYIPCHLEYIATYIKSGKNESLSVDIDRISLDAPDDKIFTLAGYGLPDIPLTPQVVPKPFFTFSNPILWICLFLALLSFIISRKMKSKRSS